MNKNFKIVIVGRRNAGKSTVMNLVTGQDVSIVSPVPGTTTDPVRKRMEVPGVGICTFVDTAGLDDVGELGLQRVKSTLAEASSADLLLVVGDAELPEIQKYASKSVTVREFDREKILDEIARRLSSIRKATIMEGLVNVGDRIILVCPVDGGAPEGRLILPQVTAIRDILDRKGIAEVLQPSQLGDAITKGGIPALVVTDSQVFGKVAQTVPQEVPLTSFSMLLARNSSCFNEYLKGVGALDNLKDGDRVLIMESCTHHASCDDIGRVKIPMMIRRHSGRRLEFDFVNGQGRPSRSLEEYALVVQCGGCMVTGGELAERLRPAVEAGVPVVNYGMAIAWMSGIFDRAVRPLLRNK